MPEVIPIKSEQAPMLVRSKLNVPIEMIKKVPVLNTSGLPIHTQWQPPTHYLSIILTGWERAVREVYRMSGAAVPKGVKFGLIYGKEASGRINDTFFIGAWKITGPGDGDTRAFRKRFTKLEKYGLVAQMLPMAMVEVNKSVKDNIESW